MTTLTMRACPVCGGSGRRTAGHPTPLISSRSVCLRQVAAVYFDCHREHRPPACRQPAVLRQGGHRVDRDEAPLHGSRRNTSRHTALVLEGRFVFIASLSDNLQGDPQILLKRRQRPLPSGAACAVRVDGGEWWHGDASGPSGGPRAARAFSSRCAGARGARHGITDAAHRPARQRQERAARATGGGARTRAPALQREPALLRRPRRLSGAGGRGAALPAHAGDAVGRGERLPRRDQPLPSGGAEQALLHHPREAGAGRRARAAALPLVGDEPAGDGR